MIEAHRTSATPALNRSCRHFAFPWCTPYVNVKLRGACAELKITYQLYGLSIRNPIRKVRIAEPLYSLDIYDTLEQFDPRTFPAVDFSAYFHLFRHLKVIQPFQKYAKNILFSTSFQTKKPFEDSPSGFKIRF